MDLAHWGFDRWPFQHARATSFNSVGAAHDEALARLLFLIDERRRCGLLIGGTGTGKSCLFRQVRSYAERKGRCSLAIDATGMDAAELAWQLECQLLVDDNHASPIRSWSQIQQSLSNHRLVGQPVVVLLDHFD